MFSFSVPADACSCLDVVTDPCDLTLCILFPSSNFPQSSDMILNVLLSLQWACGQPSIIYKCCKHVSASTDVEQPWIAALLEPFLCFMVITVVQTALLHYRRSDALRLQSADPCKVSRQLQCL